MNFDNIRDQIMDRLRSIWAEIRESSTYIQLREKYEELDPKIQKLMMLGAVLLTALLLLAYPLMNISSSNTFVTEFEETKVLLRELMQVQRELAQTPDVQPPPPVDQIRARTTQIFTDAGISPEQIQETREADTRNDPPTGLIPPSVTQAGLSMTLLKLNLKQVLDVNYALQTIASNLYVTSMDMKANKDDNHYYDVIFRVVGFTIDAPPEPPEKPGTKAAPGGKGS